MGMPIENEEVLYNLTQKERFKTEKICGRKRARQNDVSGTQLYTLTV